MTNTNSEDVNDTASIKPTVSDEPANIGDADFISYRLKQHTAAQEGVQKQKPPAQEVEEDEEQVEEEVTDEETGEEQEEQTEESSEEGEEAEDSSVEDVLSQLNLDGLTEDQIKELSHALSSRAVDRFGKLTARAKSAEEKVDYLQQQINELKENKNPLEPEKKVENNPFDEVEDIAGLQEKYKQFDDIETWSRDLLDEYEESSFDDVITEVEGKELTKREVKQYLKNAIQAKGKFLPARLEELQKVETFKQNQQALEQQAAKELSWYNDDQSDIKQRYNAMVNDELSQKLKKEFPEVGWQIDYLLAHAANSMHGMQTQQKPKPKQKIQPPSNPSATSTRGQQSNDQKLSKNINLMKEKFNETQNEQDLVNLRTLQIQNRLK